VERDSQRVRRTREIEALRQEAAPALHGLCATLVESINRLVTRVRIELDPSEYTRDGPPRDVQVFQINVSGRVVQITFRPTETLTSAERFHLPYILEGAIRWYNQESLDREEVGEHHLFCCVEKETAGWYFLDPGSRRNGRLNQEYLVELMEKLV